MSTATDMVQLCIDAEKKVLAGQSVSFNGRSVSYADLAEIRRTRKEWEARAAAEAGTQSVPYSLADWTIR